MSLAEAETCFKTGDLLKAEEIALRHPDSFVSYIIQRRMREIRDWNVNGKPLDGVFIKPFKEFPKFNRALEIVSKYANDSKLTMLDVGCFVGIWPLYLRSLGHLARGYDIHKSLMKDMDIKFGGFKFANAERLTEVYDEKFDVITFFDSLEHIIDDSKAISEAEKLLNKRGLLIIHVPLNHIYPDEGEEHMRKYKGSDIEDLIPGINTEACTDENGNPTLLGYKIYE